MSMHSKLIDLLKKQGIEKGYVIGKTSFPVPNRPSIVVDASWEREKEIVVWEVELKARYEEKLFHFHILKENRPTIKFGLIVQRRDSRKQVLRISDKLLSQDEQNSLTIQTVDELTGKSIEEQPKLIHSLFWIHRESSKKCVALFSPCAFDDGFNRGIRLTGIYLKEKGYSLNEIEGYLEWLTGKLGLSLFEAKSALHQIEKDRFPSCEEIRQAKQERAPYLLRLGDLDIEEVCKQCPHYERQ